jgi:D-alanyl-lipoteichoic acid acyltransferase DltB (MBOAT superfamily)
MAKGIALCMGFELIFNFNLPYFSSNPSEFWHRWHISLSTWLRDYLYIPLGGNKGTKLKTVGNLLLVMVLGGLWHGAAWTFVLWGFIHGILLVFHRIWIWWGGARFSIWRWFRIFIFYHMIVLTWLPFRAQSLDQLKYMAGTLFFHFQWSQQTTMMMVNFVLIVAFLWVIQWCQYRKNDLLFLYHQNKYVKTVVYAFMAYLIVGWGVMKPEQFIYFQF